ncbi:MAG: hypothetical protein HY908_02075 [Myxococcales bacterium]|nr:hypothetical protein [Myxococcales bacterium]
MSAATRDLRALVESVGATRPPSAPAARVDLPPPGKGTPISDNPSWRAAHAALDLLGNDEFALQLLLNRAASTHETRGVAYALRAVAGALDARARRDSDAELLKASTACSWLLVALEHRDATGLAAFDRAARETEAELGADLETASYWARHRDTGLPPTRPAPYPRSLAAYGKWLVARCDDALRMYNMPVPPPPAGVTYDPTLDLRNLVQRLCGLLVPERIGNVRGEVAARALEALRRARLSRFDMTDRYTKANPLWVWLWREHPSETGLDAQGLAVGALKACGVTHADAWSVVNGAERSKKSRCVTRKK